MVKVVKKSFVDKVKDTEVVYYRVECYLNGNKVNEFKLSIPSEYRSLFDDCLNEISDKELPF